MSAVLTIFKYIYEVVSNVIRMAVEILNMLRNI
jgi:hypothetical protein